MSVKAILTNRELKNKVTGLDLYVSDYQEIPHKIRNTFLYHVIVVTDLFYYKSKEQKQSDVVQFMVSKSFEEFEELYHKLYKRFPSVVFPQLPSKLSISNKTDERLQCMDKVMKLVASTQKLSSSTMLIAFLKGDIEKKPESEVKVPVVDIISKKESISSQFEEPVSEIFADPSDLSNTVENDNLFEVDLNKDHHSSDDLEGLSDLKIDSNVNSSRSGKDSLFDDDLKGDQAEDDLFTAPSSHTRKSEFEKIYDFEDDDDLLDVNDDFDDLLSLSKSSEKQAAIKVQKPSVPTRTRTSIAEVNFDGDDSEEKNSIFQRTKSQSFKKKERNDSANLDDIFSKNKKKGLFDDDDDDNDLFAGNSTINKTAEVENMGQEDIMNYILANN